MAAYLNSLHISSNYTSHQSNASSNHPDALDEAIAENELSLQSYAAIATFDLEEKLRHAHRITLCEEIRKLAADPILPQAILDRLEKPCTALVLWQPPPKISELIIPKQVERARKRNDAEQDNNNSIMIDLNNGIGMQSIDGGGADASGHSRVHESMDLEEM